LKWHRLCFLLIAAVVIWCSVPALPDVPVGAKTPIPDQRDGPFYVALTFDDGPRADTTPCLLDGLRKRNASATFFLIGEQIADNAALVERMKLEGHQVGNHTWSHKKLQGLSAQTVQQEIGRTDAELRKLLGDGTYWVRPPYGLLNRTQEKLFSVPLVHWSVDPEDWRVRNADADVAAVLRKVKPGDIILMHDSVPASVNAALRIVDTLQSRGYEFGTVEELLALNDVTPRAGVLYHSAYNFKS
jgi:peptidoglycan/xylan/chitin deacetylase (PgdA/CDA1 family)